MGEEGVLVLEARQGELIKKAAADIKDALNALNNGMPLDIISIDLRGALDSLGEITGENLDDDVLGIIFYRFCIGR